MSRKIEGQIGRRIWVEPHSIKSVPSYLDVRSICRGVFFAGGKAGFIISSAGDTIISMND